MQTDEQLQDIGQVFISHIAVLGGFILLIWGMEMFDWVIGGQLDSFGIVPRNVDGLRGIAFAPLLHAGFSHVAANTLPFLVLGWLVLLRNVRTFFLVTIIVILIGGFGTWLIGPAFSIHIGASGLIFGYFGYLLLRGIFEHSWHAVMLSLIVAFLYGGMLMGLLPQGMGISWQMHLFGFIGGGLAAYWLTKLETAV